MAGTPPRHYQGPWLDGAPVPARAAGPPPSPTIVRDHLRAAAQTAQPAPASAPSPAPEDYHFAVHIAGDDGLSVSGNGATLDDAVAAARLAYEAAQPVQPLIWGNGQPIDGLAQQVLAEALQTYRDYLGPNAQPNVIVILGRLQASLGEDPS